MDNKQQIRAVVLSVLLITAGGLASLAAAGGSDGADNGHDDDKEMSECEAFSDPVTLSFAGITVEVGPPMDLNDDGVCEDLNGDGELTLLDGVLHAVVVTAVNAGQLDLTSDQADAVDVDRDGDVDYDDALALIEEAFATDGGNGGAAAGDAGTTETTEETTETTTEEPTETTEMATETTETTTTEETTETTTEETTETTTEETTEETETTETTTAADTTTAPESPASLEITEIQADAPGDDRDNLNGEYVVITNTGDNEVDLSGYVLDFGADDPGQEYTFDSLTLGAGDSVTVHVGSGDDTQSDVYAGFGSPQLNNDDPDTVLLIDSEGNEVDRAS